MTGLASLQKPPRLQRGDRVATVSLSWGGGIHSSSSKTNHKEKSSRLCGVFRTSLQKGVCDIPPKNARNY